MKSAQKKRRRLRRPRKKKRVTFSKSLGSITLESSQISQISQMSSDSSDNSDTSEDASEGHKLLYVGVAAGILILAGVVVGALIGTGFIAVAGTRIGSGAGCPAPDFTGIKSGKEMYSSGEELILECDGNYLWTENNKRVCQDGEWSPSFDLLKAECKIDLPLCELKSSCGCRTTTGEGDIDLKKTHNGEIPRFSTKSGSKSYEFHPCDPTDKTRDLAIVEKSPSGNRYIAQHATSKFTFHPRYGWVIQYTSEFSPRAGSNVRLVCNEGKDKDEFEVHNEIATSFEKGYYNFKVEGPCVCPNAQC